MPECPTKKTVTGASLLFTKGGGPHTELPENRSADGHHESFTALLEQVHLTGFVEVRSPSGYLPAEEHYRVHRSVHHPNGSER